MMGTATSNMRAPYTITTEDGKMLFVDEWRDTTSSWSVEKKKTAKENIQGNITAKQEKMIKDEIKIWMDDHLQKEIEKIAGKLLKDIEKLKEEKTRLGKAISSLKKDMKKTKNEVAEEINKLDEILEKYDEKIMRFYNMDL